MVKKRIAYALSAAALVAGSGIIVPATYADGVTVSTFDELNTALCAGGEITLGADILADSWLASGCDYFVTKDTTIDFNGHTITSPENRSYNLDFYDATLTFEDSVGGGGYTQEGSATSGINITNGKFVINGGIINGSMWVVTLWHDAELEMNGGEINASNGFAVTGNGTTNPSSQNYGSNTKITINDGVLTSANDYVIYNPAENSTVDIYGGSLTGGSGAIAANRGTINIYDGYFKSLGTAVVEGDVAQDGTRGYENAVIGIPKEYGPVFLNIHGGTFVNENGSELIADISGLDNENEATVEIEGGNFATKPDAADIAEGNEAEKSEGSDVYVILPIKIDWAEDGYIETDPTVEGQLDAIVEFGQELSADRKATLSAVEVDPSGLIIDESLGGELIGAFDINMLDRDGVTIEVNDNTLTVIIGIDAETREMLAAYDELYAVYFDNQGVESERYDVTLGEDALSFETTHLSTYGIVGVNNETEAESDVASETASTDAPETGTVTREGASAMSAALVTAIAVGVLVSAVSFAVLIRKK